MEFKKWLPTALSAVGLGFLVRILRPRRGHKKNQTLLEMQFKAYINYLEGRVLSNELLILADTPVIEAILLAGPPGNSPVSLTVIDAIRESCGTELLSKLISTHSPENSSQPQSLKVAAGNQGAPQLAS